MEKKAYKITATAGFWVAGKPIPTEKHESGELKPKVGHVLMLTADEAENDLRQGSIELATDVAPIGDSATQAQEQPQRPSRRRDF